MILFCPLLFGGKLQLPPVIMAQLVPSFAYKPLTCQYDGAEGCGVCGITQADNAEGSVDVRECILRGHFHVARGGD